MKIGVIDVGGGLRGIYAVGIFDYCMDHQIHFDLGIGISAGSATWRLSQQVNGDGTINSTWNTHSASSIWALEISSSNGLLLIWTMYMGR